MAVGWGKGLPGSGRSQAGVDQSGDRLTPQPLLQGFLTLELALGIDVGFQRREQLGILRCRTRVSQGVVGDIPVIAAGGNNRNISDNTLANPRPAPQYAELLAALKANAYTKSQFESQKPLQKWLRGQPIPGLIDARLRSPATRQSLALTDGHYWWIFYPNADLKLTGLVICQLSVAPKIKRGAN